MTFGERICDGVFEYQYVTVPRQATQYIPVDRPMLEDEWRSLGIDGVNMSDGWSSYDVWRPEMRTVLFRRHHTRSDVPGLVTPEESESLDHRLRKEDGEARQHRLILRENMTSINQPSH